jgi:transcription elongation factor Elf1
MNQADPNRLPTVYVKRPRCPHCNSLRLHPYKTLQRSTGATWRYVLCRGCGRRGIVVLT